MKAKSFCERRRSFASLSCDEDAAILDMIDDESNACCTLPDESTSALESLLSAPLHPDMQFGSTSTPLDACTSTPVLPSRMELSYKLPIRRCLSMLDTTPTSSRTFLGKPNFDRSPTPNGAPFKRPHPPSEGLDSKRRKQMSPNSLASALEFEKLTTTKEFSQRQLSDPTPCCSPQPRPKLIRSHSESQVSIMKALSKSSKL